MIQIDQVDQGLRISVRKREGGCVGAEHRCSPHEHGRRLSHSVSGQHPVMLMAGPRHSPTGNLELQQSLHGMSPERDQNQPQVLSTQPCQGERQQGERAGVHRAGQQLADGMQNRVEGEMWDSGWDAGSRVG